MGGVRETRCKIDYDYKWILFKTPSKYLAEVPVSDVRETDERSTYGRNVAASFSLGCLNRKNTRWAPNLLIWGVGGLIKTACAGGLHS